MKIVRVFNNNIILVSDEQTNSEKILFGKGVGFQRHHGEEINPSEDDELFVRETSPDWIRSFVSLSQEIPLKYFETTRLIISFAEKQLGVEFNPFLIITLSDHLYFAVKRAQGQMFDGPVIEDVKRTYGAEFSVAEMCLDIIKEQLNVQLNQNEAGFIAIHFVENELTVKQNTELDVSSVSHEDEIITGVLNLVIEMMRLQAIRGQLNLNRLATHLRFLIRRISQHEHFQDSDEDGDINQSLRNRYPELALIADKIEQFVSETFDYQLTASEHTYLIMHLQQVQKQANHYIGKDQ